MVSIEAFSDLLEVLYSVPLQLEQWQRFLTLLSTLTESRHSFYISAGSRPGLSVLAHGGNAIISSSDLTAYNERYSQNDPFRASAVRHSCPRIVQDEDLLPNEGLLQSDFYRSLIFPYGWRYATLIILAIDIRRLEFITIWRAKDQGPMDRETIQLLNLLFPHIQKAMEIRQVLGVAHQRLAGTEAMIDASSTATFLLNKQAHILHRNSAAEALLADGDALVIQDGILAAREPGSRELIRNFIQNTALLPSSKSANIAAKAILLCRASSRRPLQLLGSPLPLADRKRSGADLVLLVTDPETPVNFHDEILCALYGLTTAEVEVANGLLTGYRLHEIAKLRGVSVGTVRIQVKSILSKTGCSRQSDLIRLFMTLSPAAIVH